MKVHFAAGTHPFDPPWRNVDYEGFQPGITDEADLLDGIPAHLTGITEAYVGHFLEHLTKEEGVEFLIRVRERMVPGGRLTVVGPDAEKGQQWYDEDRLPLELLEAIKAHGEIPADQPHNRGNVHVWDCTGHEVVDMLVEAGFSQAKELTWAEFPEGVPLINDSGWQFLAVAYAEN